MPAECALLVVRPWARLQGILSPMSMRASLILCTHNPRSDYLEEVLAGLRAQTLAPRKLELLLVDNASDEALAARWDLGWHPNGRHLREQELGLTPARIAGIEAAAAPILVFDDDDAILDADYLEIALEIAEAWPVLGAWGSGSPEGRFEVDPPEWAQPHLPWLALLRSEMDDLVESRRWVPNGTVRCGALRPRRGCEGIPPLRPRRSAPVSPPPGRRTAFSRRYRPRVHRVRSRPRHRTIPFTQIHSSHFRRTSDT